MSFSHLGLSEKVLAAVAATGYTTPTPIQEQAIPHVLARRDVLGIAQTGTGKTAAFVLPMLTMLEKGRARARMPRTLILEPTRELAAQVEESFIKYGVNHKLNVALIIGIYPLVKAFHEAGHAYATKAWGGAVHEVGIMLLIFVPAPYVDASSAWALPSRERSPVAVCRRCRRARPISCGRSPHTCTRTARIAT